MARFAPLALRASYEDVEVDIQRLVSLIAADPPPGRYCGWNGRFVCISQGINTDLPGSRGYELVFSEVRSLHEQPAFFVAAHNESRTAVLVVSGTKSVYDVLTDVASSSVPFPPSGEVRISSSQARPSVVHLLLSR
jgi:hypothetical protein